MCDVLNYNGDLADENSLDQGFLDILRDSSVVFANNFKFAEKDNRAIHDVCLIQVRIDSCLSSNYLGIVQILSQFCSAGVILITSCELAASRRDSSSGLLKRLASLVLDSTFGYNGKSTYTVYVVKKEIISISSASDSVSQQPLNQLAAVVPPQLPGFNELIATTSKNHPVTDVAGPTAFSIAYHHAMAWNAASVGRLIPRSLRCNECFWQQKKVYTKQHCVFCRMALCHDHADETCSRYPKTLKYIK